MLREGPSPLIGKIKTDQQGLPFQISAADAHPLRSVGIILGVHGNVGAGGLMDVIPRHHGMRVDIVIVFPCERRIARAIIDNHVIAIREQPSRSAEELRRKVIYFGKRAVP